MYRRTTLLAALVAFGSSALVACGPSSVQPKNSSSDRAQAATSAAGSATPSFGGAASFAVLAGTAVTCTDSTVIGDVGVSPGTSIAQTSCPVTGTINAGDSIAAAAQADFAVAYAAFQALPCTQTLTTLDGLTLAPGVYCFDAAVTSTGGVLTLDGPPAGTWIFKVGTLGTGALTGTNFSVITPAGTPPPCDSVFWWVAEGATLTDSSFTGTILAGAASTVTRGTFGGNVLAMTAVTVTGTALTGCGLGGVGGGQPSCTGKDGKNGKDEDCACRPSDHEDDGKDGSSKDSDHGAKCGHHDGPKDRDHGHDDQRGAGHD